jgi:hypothetical protein
LKVYVVSTLFDSILKNRTWRPAGWSGCLSYATAADAFGVWGGLNQQERRNLKRRKQRKNAAGRRRDSSVGSTA